MIAARKRAGWIILALSLCVATGCSLFAPRPDPTRFYVLASLAELDPSGAIPPSVEGVSLGVGPVRFPSYLRRSQVATRLSASRVEYSELAWWAEPPESDFTRVLSTNLGTLLGTERVAVYPWPKTLSLEYGVALQILRFEVTASRTAILKVRWAINGSEDNAALLVRESDISEPIASSKIEEGVESLSRALVELSREIADAIRELEAKGGAGRAG